MSKEFTSASTYKKGDKTFNGKIEDVYFIEEQSVYQYFINGHWMHETAVLPELKSYNWYKELIAKQNDELTPKDIEQLKFIKSISESTFLHNEEIMSVFYDGIAEGGFTPKDAWFFHNAKSRLIEYENSLLNSEIFEDKLQIYQDESGRAVYKYGGFYFKSLDISQYNSFGYHSEISDSLITKMRYDQTRGHNINYNLDENYENKHRNSSYKLFEIEYTLHKGERIFNGYDICHYENIKNIKKLSLVDSVVVVGIKDKTEELRKLIWNAESKDSRHSPDTKPKNQKGDLGYTAFSDREAYLKIATPNSRSSATSFFYYENAGKWHKLDSLDEMFEKMQKKEVIEVHIRNTNPDKFIALKHSPVNKKIDPQFPSHSIDRFNYLSPMHINRTAAYRDTNFTKIVNASFEEFFNDKPKLKNKISLIHPYEMCGDLKYSFDAPSAEKSRKTVILPAPLTPIQQIKKDLESISVPEVKPKIDSLLNTLNKAQENLFLFDDSKFIKDFSINIEAIKLESYFYSTRDKIQNNEEIPSSEFSKIDFESEVFNSLDDDVKEVITEYVTARSDAINADALEKDKQQNTSTDLNV